MNCRCAAFSLVATAALAVIFLAGCVSYYEPAVPLEEANVLPVEIDPDFQFRKQQTFFNDPRNYESIRGDNIMRVYRMRINYGAYTPIDYDQVSGNYYTFFWRAAKRADVTVRFEYRQAALGNFVMAKERYYPDARGVIKSEFRVTGDEYLENGRVAAWRALLIVDGRIVAIRPSYMWK